MSALLNIFATNLRHYRQLQQLTQEALAEMCGLHRTYIGAIERRERNISIRNIERLAQALQVEPFELLREVSRDG